VTNPGPSDASGVGVTDTFPSLLSGVTFTATQTGGASGFTASGSGNIQDGAVTMPANSTITYVATRLMPSSASGTISDTATVTGPVGLNDPNLANNSATDTSTITFQADLNVTVTDAGAVAGARVTYTIVVSNPGPSDVAGAMVTDTFPALLTGVSF